MIGREGFWRRRVLKLYSHTKKGDYRRKTDKQLAKAMKKWHEAKTHRIESRSCVWMADVSRWLNSIDSSHNDR